MIYVSYGVPKSASTFTYAVTEAVLKAAGHSPLALSEAAKGRKSRLNYIDPISWTAVERVASEIGENSAVIKTHGAPDKRLSEAIERDEVFASAVIRDPRDVALSLLDHARRSRRLGVRDFAEFETIGDTFGVLDDQLNRLRRWLHGRKVLLLTYDEICFETELAVQRIISQLGLSVTTTKVMRSLPERGKVDQFNKGIRRRYESEMSSATQQLFLSRYADVYRQYLSYALPHPSVLNHDQASVVSSESNPRPHVTEATLPGETCTMATTTDSDEFAAQLVQALYRMLLLREPDPKGFDAYRKRICEGQPIEYVMRAFLKSPEFSDKRARFLQTYASARGTVMDEEQLVTLLYRVMLSREPDQRELSAHAKALKSGKPAEHVARQLLSSAALDQAPPMRIDLDVTVEQEQALWAHVARSWSKLGSAEPYWSVLTDPRWKVSEMTQADARDAFYATGRRSVARLDTWLARNRLSLPADGRCAEYGCGVGRCTVWLAKRFSRVVAFDISEPHLRLAQARAESEGLNNIEFVHVKSKHDLLRMRGIDFFFSVIVLQHNPPPLVLSILKLVFQGLTSGGTAYYQVPTYALGYSFDLKDYLDRSTQRDIEMHFVPQHAVFDLAAECGLQPLEVSPDNMVGNARWISTSFLMMKRNNLAVRAKEPRSLCSDSCLV